MTQLVTRGNRGNGYGRAYRNPANILPRTLDDLEDFFNDSWMEEVFRDVNSRFSSAAINNFPPCNISTDREGTIKFEFALAGYHDEDINVNIEDDRLIVSAERRSEEEDAEEEAFIHHGIRAREFKATYPIGNRFDTSQAQATFQSGILTVRIPVAEDKKPRSLQIEVQS